MQTEPWAYVYASIRFPEEEPGQQAHLVSIPVTDASNIPQELHNAADMVMASVARSYRHLRYEKCAESPTTS